MTDGTLATAAKRPAPLVEFAVEPFSRCGAEVLAFRNLNRPTAREQEYFDWRYHRPCAHEPLILWARDSAGRPVGAASVIPHDYFFLDGVYPVGLLGDISVLPSSRGQGIAGRMLDFLARHAALRTFRACIVLPNEEAYGALARAGWRDVTTIHRFVKLINARPLLERKLGSAAPIRWLAAGINAVLQPLTPRNEKGRYVVKETRVFDARYDTLWEAAALPGRVLAVRNRAYLAWRFTQHPFGAYRVVELSEAGRLDGYVVFHQEGDLAVVDDYLVARETTVAPLFAALCERVRSEGRCAKVQIRTNGDARLALPWRRCGFLRRRDTQQVMALDPLAPDASLARVAHQWHVTPGDKDV